MLSKPKKPTVPYFTPDRRQCIILGNYDYHAIRFMGVDENGEQKEKGFDNLEEVINDMETFSENIQKYGFDSDYDIIEKKNFTWTEAKKVFNRCQK